MRIALHTRLAPGTEAEYDQAHRQVPAELVRQIRAAGATDWTIWRSGTDLFHVLECDDYAALLATLDQSPVNQAWQQRISALQLVAHDYSGAGADAALPVVWRLPAGDVR
jgi:L-rhamnose mutarotase